MTLAETGDPVMRQPVEHTVTGALWSKKISKTLRGEQTTPWSSVVLQLFSSKATICAWLPTTVAIW